MSTYHTNSLVITAADGEPMTTDTPLVVSNLDALATQIRAVAADAMRQANAATQAALTAGKLLLKAKEQVQHGAWESWVTTNCGLAVSTSRAYIGLAKKYQHLDDSNRQRVSDLPLRQALKAIATDPTPIPSYKSTYKSKRNDREKTQAVFGKAVTALKASTKLVDIGLKPKEVANLRKKLTEAIAEIDRLEASAKDAIDVAAVEVRND